MAMRAGFRPLFQIDEDRKKGYPNSKFGGVDMEKILIGTCVPGQKADVWAPHLLKLGFEALAINFHMDYEGTDLKEHGKRIRELAESHGAKINTLGYYCNPIQFESHKEGIIKALEHAKYYGANTVGTFAGAYEGKSMDESFAKFGEVFGELAKRAEDLGLRIAIENCPMGGHWDYATCNIAINEKAWERMFNLVSSDALGLEWEPGHQMIQLIDPIPVLRKWVKKVYHIHGKDASIDWHAVKTGGVLRNTDEYAPERTPGFGDTDWRIVISILRQNGFEGDIAVEGYHDPVYSGKLEMMAQKHALQYLKWCRGGDFIPTPWDTFTKEEYEK